MKNIILFTVIESDRININNNTGLINTPRLYEQEAIKCFENWRKNAGKLKDIQIICYAPTINTPTKKTIDKLEKLNITYVQNYLQESELMSVGFFLVPLVGKILEEQYPDSTMIHIDLDMNIIKEIPETYFDNNIYIGQYDKISANSQRKSNNWKLPLDTGLTISPNNSNFYSIYWKEFSRLYFDKSYLKETYWLNQEADNGIFFLEEYVADKLYNLNILPIKIIQHYQIGEGYLNIDEVEDKNLDKILFWHEHLIIEDDEYKNNRIQQKIKFFKRIKKKKG